MSSANFTSVPVLDYSLLKDQQSRAQFIDQLRHALINVGFLYLANHPVQTEELVSYIPKLFDLPQQAKDDIKMANSPHFLGYSKLGAEFTKGKVDHREQIDFATVHTCRWKEGDPDYYRLWGPSQWPEESMLPGFQQVTTQYLEQVQTLSYQLATLISEALGLGADGFSQFYDTDELMQHRAKIVKYPSSDNYSQGVGPHYDAGFLTFLLQASPHTGLQVQNLTGDWIDVPPIPNTFVVNIGKALEFVTQGLARATSHRVLSPTGVSPRYSIPFFQNISLNIKLVDNILQFPPEITVLGEARGNIGKTDSVNFSEFDREPSGRVNLIGRVKSHPDVAEIHYPKLFADIFSDGLPAQANAY